MLSDFTQYVIPGVGIVAVAKDGTVWFLSNGEWILCPPAKRGTV